MSKEQRHNEILIRLEGIDSRLGEIIRALSRVRVLESVQAAKSAHPANKAHTEQGNLSQLHTTQGSELSKAERSEPAV